MFDFFNKNSLSSLTVIQNKTPIFLKSDNFINYFFLTNNFILINNYRFFSFYNSNLFNFKTIKNNILIKKNNYFIFKNILKFKKYLRLSLTLNKFKFKFTTFFKFIFFNSLKKINKTSNLFINFFYFNNIKINFFYKKRFYRNWQNLIGNFISPFSITLFSKKKWIRRNKTFHFFSNRFFNKNKNKIKRNAFIIKKKHIINNFFYLNKSFNLRNYPSMPFLIKNNLNYSISKKNNYDFFLSRPYMFLNNPRMGRNFKKYSNFLTINFYKKYLKFFNFVRRINISNRVRINNSFAFKNLISYTRTIYKIVRGKNFFNLKPVFNWFSFFTKKNKSFFYSNKKSYKRRSLYFWRFSFSFKTKFSKRNKFFIIKKSSFNKNLELIKFSKRVKKGNFFLKTIWLRKKLSNLSFIKIRWSPALLTLSLKSFFFNKPLNFSVKFFSFNFIWLNSFLILSKLKQTLHLKKNNNKSKRFFFKSKKPFFFSKNKTNFILNRYSFIFINNFYTSFSDVSSFYNFKKIMFSFSYKNEIQKYILRKYSKITFSLNFKNFQSNKFFFNKSIFFSQEKSTLGFSYFNALFNKKNELYPFLIQNSANKLNWAYFNNQTRYAFNSENDQINFNIKRIKFKPGYMNIWREARSVLKTSLMLKIKYQYRLTSYLSKYKKFINFKTFLFMEMRIFNILIKSRLFNNESLLSLFFKNNLIFLNGFNCSNPNLQTFVGDFIQLIVNLKYYILYRWFSSLSLKKKNKLKNVLRKKNNSNTQSDEKKKSYSFPKWITYSKNTIDDVSNFLETDYLTLSVFILYEPFVWSDLNTYNLIDQRFTVINLYNWKYIT